MSSNNEILNNIFEIQKMGDPEILTLVEQPQPQQSQPEETPTTENFIKGPITIPANTKMTAVVGSLS